MKAPDRCRALAFTYPEGEYLLKLVLFNLNEMKANMPKKQFETDEHVLMVAQIADKLLRVQN